MIMKNTATEAKRNKLSTNDTILLQNLSDKFGIEPERFCAAIALNKFTKDWFKRNKEITEELKKDVESKSVGLARIKKVMDFVISGGKPPLEKLKKIYDISAEVTDLEKYVIKDKYKTLVDKIKENEQYYRNKFAPKY